MARFSPVPYFPTPPAQYDQRYFDQVLRSFAVFARQMTNPGEMRATSLTLTESTTNVDRGELRWDVAEETMKITMGNGVEQSVGLENYMMVFNDTGSLITNGTVLGFSGVGPGPVAGDADVYGAPFIADGSFKNLYFIGVATCDIPDGERRPITIYGELHDIDTTGTDVGETWVAGDILYASPTYAGKLTKVRPSAPDEVIVVAAVLDVDSTDGELLVRPTVPIQMNYGRFSSTVDQTAASTNTAYSVTYNTTNGASGVSVVSNSQLTVEEAGYYSVNISVQITSTNSSSSVFYIWLSKNGTNVANTTRAYTIKANGDTHVLFVSYDISLAANDYVELKWATSSTQVFLDATSGLAFAPDIPSVLVSVTQTQL